MSELLQLLWLYNIVCLSAARLEDFSNMFGGPDLARVSPEIKSQPYEHTYQVFFYTLCSSVCFVYIYIYTKLELIISQNNII
jgi:hypothetical protein